MSNAQYGGIDLPTLALTTECSEEPVYSADGLILECVKFTYETHTVLTPSMLTSSMVGLGVQPGSGPAQIEQVLSTTLNTPRLKFRVFDEGGRLWRQSPADGAVADVNGGPFPSTRITWMSTGCWEIHFKVVTYLPACNSSSGTPNDVLNNRWAVSVRYDQNFYAHRDITGKLRVSKAHDMNPDSLRQNVLPQIPDGFIRENFKYAYDSAAMALEYSFTDRQDYCMPPKLQDGTQATDIKGEYSETTSNGLMWFSDIVLELVGQKATDKGRLFQQGIIIALSYVGIGGQVKKGQLDSATLSTNFHTNNAKLHIRTRRFDANNMSNFGVSESRMLVVPPGTESGKALDPGSYGSWLATTVHAALTSPCTSGNIPTPTLVTGSNTPAKSSSTGYKPNVYGVPSVDTAKPYLSPTQLAGDTAYTEYRVDARYYRFEKKVCLPTAGPSGASPQIVQVANPHWMKKVFWTAERMGSPPAAPIPETNDANEVFAGGIILETAAPELNPDKVSYTYRDSGVLYYYLKQPPSTYISGNLPYNSASSPGSMTSANFQHGIIDQG